MLRIVDRASDRSTNSSRGKFETNKIEDASRTLQPCNYVFLNIL